MFGDQAPHMEGSSPTNSHLTHDGGEESAIESRKPVGFQHLFCGGP